MCVWLLFLLSTKQPTWVAFCQSLAAYAILFDNVPTTVEKRQEKVRINSLQIQYIYFILYYTNHPT